MKLKNLRRFFLLSTIAFMTTAAQADDIKIGAIFPLSGPNSSYGDITAAGANLAVEHINAEGNLDGTLSILYEDSQALPQHGVVAMNKLVGVENVPFVLTQFTGVSKAVSVIGQKTQTVVINGGATGPDLATLGPYFWNMIPLVNFEVRALVPYLMEERNMTRPVLLFADEPGAQATRQEVEALMEDVNKELVGALSIPPTLQQFSGIAARVRSLNPDFIIMATAGSQQAQLIKQLRDNGVDQPIVSYSVFGIPEILGLPEAEGALYTSQSVNWESDDPITQRFVNDFKERYGDATPSAYAVNYYNAVYLFGLLAAELQKKGKPITGENLLEERLAMDVINVVGGPVSFQPDGTIKAPIQINEIDGKGGSSIVTVVPSN